MTETETLSAVAVHRVAQQRAAAIAEAKTWIGAQFCLNNHFRGPTQSMSRTDCGRVVGAAYRAAGLAIPEDFAHIPRGIHLHKADGRYRKIIETFCRGVVTPQPADIAAFIIGRDIAHIGLVIEWPEILHCMESQPVMIQNVTPSLLGRWHCHQTWFYSPW